MRRPTVARNGLGALPMISTAAPVPIGRSTQIVVVSRKLDVDAEVGRQRRLDDLLLHLAVERDEHLLPDVVLPQVDQRVLLGELGERDVQRASVGGACGNDDRLQRRRREVMAARAVVRDCADRVADLDIAETPELADLTCGDRRAPDGRAAVEHADRGDLALVVPAELQPIPHAYRSREHPNIGDLLPGRAAFDLEHACPRPGHPHRLRPAGQQLVMPAISESTPAPVIAEPKNTGCTSACLVCAASSLRSRRYETSSRRRRRRQATHRRGRRAARPAER